MSTVAEIQAALFGLSIDELQQIERTLHAIYRQRKSGIVYDDSYGTTESDLIAAADEAFLAYDREEEQQDALARRGEVWRSI